MGVVGGATRGHTRHRGHHRLGTTLMPASVVSRPHTNDGPLGRIVVRADDIDHSPHEQRVG